VFHNPQVGWEVNFMKAPGVLEEIKLENNAKLA
jgi:hypothetical protein